MKRLAIFASGGGTNMEAIAQYFQENRSNNISIACVITDQKEAFVRERAKRLDIPCQYLTREQLNDPDFLLPLLNEYRVDTIILAGYLRLIPPFLLQAFPQKIVNIHPALLPKFGGKGMYGMRVHEAVKRSEEHETGITIHVIDEEYDKGSILFQASVEIDSEDSPEDIANKVHQLEHKHFAPTIEKWLMAMGE